MSRLRTTPSQQFDRLTEVNGSCLLWTGAVNQGGYGLFRPVMNGVQDRSRLAHRWAYEAFVGPIPHGLVIDHLCRNRACVNFRHLEPVTQAENVHRGVYGNYTHCIRGHEYTEQNTGRTKAGRFCKRCKADAQNLRNRRVRSDVAS